MKRVLALALILVFGVMGTNCYAILDDNSQNQQQGQIGINDNDNLNQQGQKQGQIGINEQDQGQAQGQGQGQAAIAAQAQGQVVGQGNDQNTKIGGDNTEVNTFVPPMTPAVLGTTSFNASSPLGNVGVSMTARYIMIIEQFNLIQKMRETGSLTQDDADLREKLLLMQYEKETESKRILGLMFEKPCRLWLLENTVCF